jgi:ATP-dependent Clp protease ATP-binding subunit ClpC
MGRKISFKNTIIIMTSNIGARQLKDFGQGVGFATAAKKERSDDYSKGVIQSALKKAFAPEFLNRIDDIMVFNNLSKEDINQIIDIELEGLYKRTTEMGFTVEISDVAKDFIADKGFDAEYGARPLARAIQKYVEDPLAEEIIQSRLVEGDMISIKLDDKKENIKIDIVKPSKKVEAKADAKELPEAKPKEDKSDKKKD